MTHDHTTLAEEELGTVITVATDREAESFGGGVLVKSVRCQCGSEDVIVSVSSEQREATVNFTVDRQDLFGALTRLKAAQGESEDAGDDVL